jgi:3-oxoacyl-[acyl-carrier-protein] synthase II
MRERLSMRRVVVTGLGVVAPNGIGAENFWTATLQGRSGISYIESFDTAGHTVKIGGEIKAWDPRPYLTEPARKNLKIMSRTVQFGVAAARLAVDDAGLAQDWAGLPPERVGVVMGTGIIPIDLGELAPSIAAATNGVLRVSRFARLQEESLEPLWLLRHLPNMVAAHISLAFNCQGPNNTVVTACAAGTQAIGEAFRLIRYGHAEIVLAGGADSRLDPLLFVAYTALGAVSRSQRPPEQVSRPFDAERDGFVLAEGAGVLVLEDYDHARRRGARIYAEVIGYGSSFDAFAITRPEPEGRGAALAIQAALQEAQLNVDEVSYINAHGTSTKLNDLMETRAIKRVFGAQAYRIPCSSIKSMIGHLIGASGAVEAAASVLAIRDQVVPPTINLEHPDPECDLDYVPHQARDMPVHVVLSNSFGFGGQNACVVFRKL